uniref:Uncharacterized protein n=1 Tax=Triticum urartu TaxID=4572 RepID=A0A8R7PG32_TRIUA
DPRSRSWSKLRRPSRRKLPSSQRAFMGEDARRCLLCRSTSLQTDESPGRSMR